MSSCVFSCVCSFVSSVSSSLEPGRGIEKLFKVLIWGLPCKCFSRVSFVADGDSGSECSVASCGSLACYGLHVITGRWNGICLCVIWARAGGLL